MYLKFRKARSAISCILVYALCGCLPARGDADLHIVVVEGDNATNILKKKLTVRPVIEVRDASDEPLAGALVSFTTPSIGPTAVFDNGGHTAVIVTDAKGRAALSGVTAENPGFFEYEVRVMYQDHSATATVGQTNVTSSGAAAPQPAEHSHKLSGRSLALIIGGVVAGAGIGIILGTQQSGKTAPTTPTATIAAGSGATAGAPH
jgi:hypothetical protein